MQTDVALQRLRELIVEGTYRPGTRLTEVDAAASLSMSRTPIREALRVLTTEGLVRPTGRGVTVVALEHDELQDAYQVRAELEGLTAELAATRQRNRQLAPADLDSLREAGAVTAAVTSTGQKNAAITHNRRFHLRIAELSGNKLALATLKRIWDQIQISVTRSLDEPDRPAVVAEQHERLVTAIENGLVADAGVIARQHVLDTHATTHRERNTGR